ncbi:MAG TPA: DUF3089 domain-containing protein, partial [Caulobacteraceae bacterium]|nr:DUF3089 domain-containing protein [Caulobacteraceae bacterium]
GAPRQPFDAAAAPPAPDYARPEAWAAWPGRPSAALETPEGVGPPIAPEAARVDVFFIHPTTYLAGESWNARYDEGGRTGAQVDGGVLRYQASVFNGCCRIYAPRYRQAVLAAFLKDEPDSFRAIDLAYADVARAFDWYLAHENHGRPFIIASHSQGSIHAMRLLQEKVIGTPLQKRLVYAVVAGSSVPAAIEARGLPVCRTPTQTGCLVNWNAVRRGADDARRRDRSVIWFDGRYELAHDQPIACVNPLTWVKDGAAGPDANLGAEPARPGGGAMAAPIPHVTGAWCENGEVGVDISPDTGRTFNNIATLGGIYHVYDYNLFYMNIRANAERRVRAFLAKRTG